jgi:DNA-binding CsgD family transcriptional regulator
MMLHVEPICRLSDLELSMLLHARHWEELRDCAQSLLVPLESCDFMLRMDITSSSTGPASHLFGTLPTPILNSFCASADEKVDPVDRHLARSNRPISWQVDQLCNLKAGKAYVKLKEHGICHGLSVALRSERAVSRVDFYGNAREYLPRCTTRQADALLFGVYLHEAAEMLWDKGTGNHASRLTVRELECLTWCASGKTSSEIGVILGISQHTVYFHLKNVATKLSVFGTRHAISRAIMMGIIKPNT